MSRRKKKLTLSVETQDSFRIVSTGFYWILTPLQIDKKYGKGMAASVQEWT